MSETATTYNRTVLEFADGTTVVTPIAPLGGTTTYQSAYRRTKEYRIPYDAMTFEEVEALYTNAEAMCKVNLTEYGVVLDENGTPTVDDEGNVIEVITAQEQHLNYTMPMDLKLTTINGIKAWCVPMAQMSDVEIMQAQQASDITDTQAALIELADIVAGGEV